MRNLLATPHPSSEDIRVVGADWVEINCLFKAGGNISREDFARAIARLGSIRDQRAQIIAADVFSELQDRIDACRSFTNTVNAYPFVLNEQSTALMMRRPFQGRSSTALLYWFLLLVCRVNMDSRSRILVSLDPTKLFEMVCADVLRSFWGCRGRYADALIFGTARPGVNRSFRKSINQLCELLGEGLGWKPDARVPGGGDGSLDVVAWRKFSDNRPGSLIGFGQCKTGLHWKDELDKLQPAKFSRRFFRQPFVVEPVRLYMVPWRVDKEQWTTHTDRGGILLDRCRIAQYGDAVAPRVLMQCRAWANAAVQQYRERTRAR